MLKQDYFYRQVSQLPRASRYCQSCARLFSSTRKYGKEMDGTENKCFCKDCYDNGEFAEPNLTKYEVLQRLKKAKLIYPRYLIARVRIKNLDRWNPNLYFE